MLEMRALEFEPHHFLFDIFDRKLQQYIEGDFINFNNRVFNGWNDAKTYEEFRKPFAILTLKDLEAGFVVCMMPFVLAILLFVIEWIPTLKNLIVFLCTFGRYFDLKSLEQSQHSDLMKTKVAELQAVIQLRKITYPKPKKFVVRNKRS